MNIWFCWGIYEWKERIECLWFLVCSRSSFGEIEVVFANVCLVYIENVFVLGLYVTLMCMYMKVCFRQALAASIHIAYAMHFSSLLSAVFVVFATSLFEYTNYIFVVGFLVVVDLIWFEEGWCFVVYGYVCCISLSKWDIWHLKHSFYWACKFVV